MEQVTPTVVRSPATVTTPITAVPIATVPSPAVQIATPATSSTVATIATNTGAVVASGSASGGADESNIVVPGEREKKKMRKELKDLDTWGLETVSPLASIRVEHC